MTKNQLSETPGGATIPNELLGRIKVAIPDLVNDVNRRVAATL